MKSASEILSSLSDVQAEGFLAANFETPEAYAARRVRERALCKLDRRLVARGATHSEIVDARIEACRYMSKF